MIFTVDFTGRQANAIGACYPISASFVAPTYVDFIEQFYARYECGPIGRHYKFAVEIHAQPQDLDSDVNEALFNIGLAL